MVKISASILSAKDLKNSLNELNKLDIDFIHLDVMDGKYVENISFNAEEIEFVLNSAKPIDVHLMVMNIEEYVNYFISKKVDSISLHYELINDLSVIDKIRNNNIKCGIAINPDMPIEVIYPILNKIDKVLIMSVIPGFGGQKFISDSLEKIEKLKKEIKNRNLNVLISVDGGINNNSSIECIDKGVDILVIGSALINNKNKEEFISDVKLYEMSKNDIDI